MQIGVLADRLEAIIWSDWLVGLCLLAGIYFTIRMGFPQVRLLKDMITQLRSQGKTTTGITPFQAFAVSVGGRVGVGNIAGVATAIALGGPGAVFWMWLSAFLGAGSAFTESALAQAYKVKSGRDYLGGPAYYIEKGIGTKWFAAVFAVITILAPGILMPSAQTYTIAESVESGFGLHPAVTGVILVVLLAAVIFGGIRRIGKFSAIIAPLMAIGYVLVALIIIGANIRRVPEILSLIFSLAFGMDAVYGGILGSAISWGVKRGVYSNEAGQGSGAMVAAAAEGDHPAGQGLVQAFSIYIDTLIICSATAFMILITDSYNIVGEGLAVPITENLPGVESGVLYAQEAVNTLLSGFGEPFVAISVFLFAFTTLISYYYQAATNIRYLFSDNKTAVFIFRLVFLGTCFFGVVRTSEQMWTFGDLGVGVMAWLNLIAILLLSDQGIRVLKDYEAQKKQGLSPVFNPAILELKSEVWEERFREKGTDTTK